MPDVTFCRRSVKLDILAKNVVLRGLATFSTVEQSSNFTIRIMQKE
jgi:hypothetical protein